MLLHQKVYWLRFNPPSILIIFNSQCRSALGISQHTVIGKQTTQTEFLAPGCTNATLFTRVIIYRGEYPTLAYPCRRAYRKVKAQQQGFVVRDVPEVKNLSKSPNFHRFRRSELPYSRMATQVTPSPVV